MRHRAGMALSLIAFVGCADILGPHVEPLPDEAVAFIPPAYFDTLWDQVSACSGITSAQKPAAYFTMPIPVDSPYAVVDGKPGQAWYQIRARRLIVVSWIMDASEDSIAYRDGWEPHRLNVIRHEMLHAHLAAVGLRGHPAGAGEACKDFIDLWGWRDS